MNICAVLITDTAGILANMYLLKVQILLIPGICLPTSVIVPCQLLGEGLKSEFKCVKPVTDEMRSTMAYVRKRIKYVHRVLCYVFLCFDWKHIQLL